MISDEILEKVSERIIQRLQNVNIDILKQIGNKLDEIGKLSPTQAQQLVQTLKYGGDYNKIIKELAKITKLNTKDIKEIFEEVAKNDYAFAKQFYDYRGIGYIPFEENVALQSEIKAIANITARRCAKMMSPRVLGFGLIDKETGEKTFKGLKQAYYDLLDEAVLSVSQGKETFNQAMKKRIKEIGSGGLKVIYDSTYINKDGNEVNYTRRLDSAIRMNLKDSLRELHNETQSIFGEEFGADGVEISVHENPAPDHEQVQGRQFSNEEFEKFQNDKTAISYDGIVFPPEYDGRDRRSISEYNCYHYTFSIVLGVSKPEYTNEELQAIIDRNNKGFEFEGKHYTRYEGTQLQRQIETAIREQKDIQIMAKESGQDELVKESQQKITQLTNKYKELSKVGDLPTKMERMSVSGYRRTKIKDTSKQTPIINRSKHIVQEPPLKKYQEIIDNAENGGELGEETYKNMLDDYNKWYNTLDKKEVAKVIDDYRTHAQEENKKESNPLGDFLNQKFGYDGLPELIDEKEYWKDIDGDPVRVGDTYSLERGHWFRGIGSEKAQQYIEEFKGGKYFAGEGYDGNGTYFSSSYEEANAYAGRNAQNIIFAIPKEDAKILDTKKIFGVSYGIQTQLDFNEYMNEEGELYINFMDYIFSDYGYTATIFGYDIIDQGVHSTLDKRKVVLNRRSIKVVK